MSSTASDFRTDESFGQNTTQRPVERLLKEIDTTPNNSHLVPAPIVTLGIPTAVLGIALIIRLVALRKSHMQLLTRRASSPCKNCRFFQSNTFLNCAVHPTRVLTEAAYDCPDYSSTKDRTPPEPSSSQLR